MEKNKLQLLLNLTSTIGLNFDINVVSLAIESPLNELIKFFEETTQGNNIFQKISSSRFKYKDTNFKTQILSKLNYNEKSRFKNLYKKNLITFIQQLFKDILINEVEKINKDRILSFFLYFTYYIISLDYIDLAEQNIDFVIQRIYPRNEDYEKALIAKAHILYKKKDFKNAITYLNKINIFPEQILRKFNFLTSIYFLIGNEEDCDKIYKEWDKFNQFMIFFNKIRRNLNKIFHLTNLNRYKDALKELDSIKNDFMDAENKYNYIYLYTLMGDYYNSYGLNYFEISEFENAKEAFHKSVEYYKKAGFDRDLLVPYNNIAEIYKMEKLYNKAINIYKDIINIARALGNKESYGISLWNIGEIYFIHKKYDKAQSYFTKASSIISKTDNYPRYENYFKLYFAKLLYMTNQFSKAEEMVNDILLSSYEKQEKKIYAEGLLLKGKLVGHKGEDPKSFFQEAESIFQELGANDLLKEVRKLKLMYY